MDNAYLPAAETLCRMNGIPCPVAEFKFHPKRKWRFDLAWESARLAIEIDGAVWTNGRHVRGGGYTKDQEKGNAAVMLNWKTLHYTPQQFLSGVWVEDVRHILETHDEP